MTEPFKQVVIERGALGVTTVVLGNLDANMLAAMLIHIGKGRAIDESVMHALGMLGTRIALGR